MAVRVFSGVVVAVLASAGAAHASLIVNGSFEDSSVPAAGSFDTQFPGSTAITGWMLSGANVDRVVAPYWQANDGVVSIDMNGNGGLGGTLSQTVATIAGHLYRLSFAASANYSLGAGQQATMDVGIGGTFTPFTYTVPVGGNGAADMHYVLQHYDFTATGVTLISFASTTNNCCQGVVLDNVAVNAAVPEPATWAMLIAGFGLAGAAFRRRGMLAGC